MKKLFNIILIAGLSVLAVSCKKEIPQPPVPVSVQLQFENAAFQVEGITVTLTDAAGTAYFEADTDATGEAGFTVPAGSYTASAVYKITKDGERIAYNGSNNTIVVTPDTAEPFVINLLQVISQQIIIKELYNGGCVAADEAGSYQSDQYVVLYNNSPDVADASNIVFAITAPYESYTENAYYSSGNTLLYEHEDWIPAAGALWWFTAESVTIQPWSQIVVVFKKAVDHTIVNPNSVDLSKPDYYWMNNGSITQYSRAGYEVSENIPASHYLTGACFAMSPTGWPITAGGPAFFIGKMPRDEANALCLDSEKYDVTLGTPMIFAQVKFPKADVVDAVEVWTKDNESTSHVRFPADINSNYVSITTKLGYSIYRNVDKAATEALEENAGKLVYGYTGGTDDIEGSTDPSGIDAEASIANGAHIVYSETNDSKKDFHQRKVASLK